jgi:hypothetical protein
MSELKIVAEAGRKVIETAYEVIGLLDQDGTLKEPATVESGLIDIIHGFGVFVDEIEAAIA